MGYIEKKKIAWLIYTGFNAGAKRQKNSSFEGAGNQGALVVSLDIEKATGITPEHCTAETAKNFDIILVSFTSNYDMLAFARAVYRLPEWRKANRQFRVIGGGFGMQNPYHIQEFIDYCYFGRSEGEIGEIIKAGFDHPSDSLMHIREKGLHHVLFRQSAELMQFETQIGDRKVEYHEEMHGCPNKCTYCHFTYARKHEGLKDFVLQLSGGRSMELEWMDACLYIPDKPEVTTAIDGISERSRYLHARRLSNEDVERFFSEILIRTTCANAVILTLYNIVGMEGAYQEDWETYIDIIERVRANNKTGKMLVIKMTNTPFRPSVITPTVWSRVSLDYRNEFSQRAYDIIYNTEFSVKYNENQQVKLFQRSVLESPASLLSDMCVSRGGAKDSEKIFNLFAYNSKFNSLLRGQQLEYMQSKYDLNDITREYSTSEQIPTWFLQSYIPNTSLVAIREKTIANLKKTWDSPTKRFI